MPSRLNFLSEKSFALLFLAACLALTSADAAAPRDPYEYFFHETFGDFSEELERAREEGKRGVMLFFEMDECPFCHRMKQTVLNQPEVQDYYRERFLLFSVDVEGDLEIADFAGEPVTQKEFALQRHRVRATPVFAFFDLDGRVVARYTGAASGPQEFIWLGEYVADGHYSKSRFTRFKREKRAALD